MLSSSTTGQRPGRETGCRSKRLSMTRQGAPKLMAVRTRVVPSAHVMTRTQNRERAPARSPRCASWCSIFSAWRLGFGGPSLSVGTCRGLWWKRGSGFERRLLRRFAFSQTVPLGHCGAAGEVSPDGCTAALRRHAHGHRVHLSFVPDVLDWLRSTYTSGSWRGIKEFSTASGQRGAIIVRSAWKLIQKTLGRITCYGFYSVRWRSQKPLDAIGRWCGCPPVRISLPCW